MPNINLLKNSRIGVTTFENDQTLEEENLSTALFEPRLVIGFSRVGIPNKVVRISNTSDRRRYFGEIDQFLESRGCYFHRFIDICLQEGPVLALNLLALDNSENGDKVDYQSLSTSPSTTNAVKIREYYSSFFSKERMWNPSKDNLVSIINSNIESKDKIISFVNLGQTPCSVLIKKSDKIQEFDVYAHEYYGGIENVPYYISPFDKLSEYFVDVKIVRGDFTNYSNLSTDPVYSKYFNDSGLKKESVVSLEGSSDFNVILSTTGCILPDIIDGTGTNYSIDAIINRTQISTGVFCSINMDTLNDLLSENHTLIDLIGHSLVEEDSEIDSVNFLSYKFNLLENLIYTKKETFTSDNVPLSSADSYQNSPGINENGLFSNRLTLDGLVVQADLLPKHSIIELNDSKYGTLNSFATSAADTLISYTHPDKSSEGSFYYTIKSINTGTKTIVINGQHPDLGYDMVGESIYVTDGVSKYYFKIESFVVSSENNHTSIVVVDGTNLTNISTQFKVTWSAGYIILSADEDDNKIVIKGSWDFADISGDLTADTIYIKFNDGKTGSCIFTASEILSTGNTQLTLSDCDIITVGGSSQDYITLEKMSELIFSPAYITFGVRGLTRPVVTADNIKIVYTPDVVEITSGKVRAYKYSQLFKDWESGILVSGDSYYKEITGPTVKEYYLGISHVVDFNNIECLLITNYLDISLTTTDSEVMVFGNKKKLPNGTFESVVSTDLAISSKVGNINEKIQLSSTFDNNTKIRLTSTNGDKLKVGDYVNSIYENDGIIKNYLSPILTKKKVIIDNTTFFDITLPRSAKIFIESSLYYIEKYRSFDDFVDSYNLFSLSGFKLTDYHLPGNSLNKYEQLVKILSVIDNTNLKESLTDRNLVDYQYVVDSFDSLITNEVYPKTILSKLCKDQEKSFAFLNGPSISAFTNSTDPIFSSSVTNKVFEPIYLKTGGNLEFGPSVVFSPPSELNGAKYSAMVGPYIEYLKANGQRIKIPLAAHISNLFIRKDRNGDTYKVAAGTTRGFLNDPRIVGIENISQNDLGFFKDIGYNCVINKSGYGMILYGNYTCYRKDSALSNLDIRDMLGSVERLIENLLDRYVFENNTPRTRIDVFNDLTDLLYPLKGEAFFDYEIKIDETNNNNEILNNSYGLVKVDIYPLSYIEKFFNVLNIKKGKPIEASGFQF